MTINTLITLSLSHSLSLPPLSLSLSPFLFLYNLYFYIHIHVYDVLSSSALQQYKIGPDDDLKAKKVRGRSVYAITQRATQYWLYRSPTCIHYGRGMHASVIQTEQSCACTYMCVYFKIQLLLPGTCTYTVYMYIVNGLHARGGRESTQAM